MLMIFILIKCPKTNIQIDFFQLVSFAVCPKLIFLKD